MEIGKIPSENFEPKGGIRVVSVPGMCGPNLSVEPGRPNRLTEGWLIKPHRRWGILPPQIAKRFNNVRRVTRKVNRRLLGGV